VTPDGPSNRIDATEDGNQPTDLQRVLDQPAADADRKKLPATHHPVLPYCELLNVLMCG